MTASQARTKAATVCSDYSCRLVSLGVRKPQPFPSRSHLCASARPTPALLTTQRRLNAATTV